MARGKARGEQRKRAAYRKRNQNRFSMILVVMAVALITAAVAIRSVELTGRLERYAQREAELEKQIEEADRQAEEIENFRKYTQTKRYVEEVANEKLGLVYEGEILFKEND